ncbi:YhbP family protein [Photobacterium lucens]|uniref:YhbP family protein n=1 Tax=Photobacterium lucens TaxID=2562949 RepID=UPI0006B50B69|nr:YhbP family protein [Photobacterium lucens]KPA53087.1 hypothetical protein VT25_08690 [Photobacterium leiognathi subsp. mandapamensis]MBP2700041.1 hypothetical protein [Vibrio parahaemolyticus]MZG55881.1 hypothetical protein [Photobacterium lucens]MZG81830.1 hypothetical protein [Photobacterium lucens]
MDQQAHIATFIEQHHLLTLCASFQSNLWCANCYYAFDKQTMALYIMTSPESRHGKLMICNKFISGTIAPEPDDINDIQGVQFSGEVKLLEMEEAKNAENIYNQRFPIAKKIPSSLWKITLNELKMTDNRIKFGFKLSWQRY